MLGNDRGQGREDWLGPAPSNSACGGPGHGSKTLPGPVKSRAIGAPIAVAGLYTKDLP
jgi:hypothetical protein